MAGLINKFLLDITQYFRLSQNADGTVQPTELNPFVQINYPFRDSTGLWPLNIFNQRAIGAPNALFINANPAGPNGIPANGPIKYWYVFGASITGNDAVAQQGSIQVEPPAGTTIAENVTLESGTFMGANQALPLRRPILLPPGSVIRGVTGALSAGANIELRLYYCEYDIGDRHPFL